MFFLSLTSTLHKLSEVWIPIIKPMYESLPHSQRFFRPSPCRWREEGGTWFHLPAVTHLRHLLLPLLRSLTPLMCHFFLRPVSERGIKNQKRQIRNPFNIAKYHMEKKKKKNPAKQRALSVRIYCQSSQLWHRVNLSLFD